MCLCLPLRNSIVIINCKFLELKSLKFFIKDLRIYKKLSVAVVTMYHVSKVLIVNTN